MPGEKLEQAKAAVTNSNANAIKVTKMLHFN